MKRISEQNNITNNFVVEPDFKAVVAKDAPAEERRHRKEKGTDILFFISISICRSAKTSGNTSVHL